MILSQFFLHSYSFDTFDILGRNTENTEPAPFLEDTLIYPPSFATMVVSSLIPQNRLNPSKIKGFSLSVPLPPLSTS